MALNQDSQELSEFRQIPYRPKHPKYKHKQTKGEVVQAKAFTKTFLANLRKKIKSNTHITQDLWNECIPTKFHNNTSPNNLRMNVLYVSTENSLVKQEIMFQERNILKKLQKTQTGSKIEKIRFL